jgi:hypothetical protein
VKIPAKKD